MGRSPSPPPRPGPSLARVIHLGPAAAYPHFTKEDFKAVSERQAPTTRQAGGGARLGSSFFASGGPAGGVSGETEARDTEAEDQVRIRISKRDAPPVQAASSSHFLSSSTHQALHPHRARMERGWLRVLESSVSSPIAGGLDRAGLEWGQGERLFCGEGREGDGQGRGGQLGGARPAQH